MDDITQDDHPIAASVPALRARLGTIATPHWARRPGASPRFLARGLLQNAGVGLLPGTFAPVALTLAVLWSAGGHLQLTAIALLCEALALAHIGLCLLASTANETSLAADPTDDPEALVLVSRLVGVIALVVACGALVPLITLAGMRLLLLAAVGFVLALLAISARLTRFRYVPVNALLAVALGFGLALATLLTQGRSLTGGLALLTGGVGAVFGASLGERHALASAPLTMASASRMQALWRATWGVLLIAGFLTACLSGLAGRPLAGALLGLLALPSVLVAATSSMRARGHRAVSRAMTKDLYVQWLLFALLLFGLVGWGALSRWVF